VTEGVPVDYIVCQKIHEDANPVGVVAVDREAEVIVEERVDARAAGVETEPRKRVIAEEGATRSNCGV
jgi:hypothetical protein